MFAETHRLAETAAVLTYRITQKETGNGTELMTITAFLLIFAETHRLAETAGVLTYRIAQKETRNGTELMTITAFFLMFAETQVGRNWCHVDIQKLDIVMSITIKSDRA